MQLHISFTSKAGERIVAPTDRVVLHKLAAKNIYSVRVIGFENFEVDQTTYNALYSKLKVL